ncbi:MAG: acyltransferase family protein [Chitinophagaceae bacterium]
MELHQGISAFTSSKMRFWSFISMVLLVFVHGYNLNDRYLQPWSTVSEPLGFNTFTQYFLANALFRFRIPLLFIISGYLFALGEEKETHKQRVKKRVKTLLLPYFLWSGIGLAITFLLEVFPVSKAWVKASELNRISDTVFLLHEYDWKTLLGRWLIIPIPFQLWFIRVLFIYNLAYLIIKKWVLHPVYSKWFFGVVLFLWLHTAGFVFFEAEGLLFFGLGILLQKKQINIEKWANVKLPTINTIGLTFIGLSLLKTVLAFSIYRININEIVAFYTLSILHKLIVLLGLIYAWFGLNKCVAWFMNKSYLKWLTSFSFIIYALHVPIITYLITPFTQLFAFSKQARFISFLFLPTLIIIASILIGLILKILFPKVYFLLTGNRGK